MPKQRFTVELEHTPEGRVHWAIFGDLALLPICGSRTIGAKAPCFNVTQAVQDACENANRILWLDRPFGH